MNLNVLWLIELSHLHAHYDNHSGWRMHQNLCRTCPPLAHRAAENKVGCAWQLTNYIRNILQSSIYSSSVNLSPIHSNNTSGKMSVTAESSSTSPYKSLNSASKEIRLLVIQPGPRSSDICCSLFHTSLTAETPANYGKSVV